MKFPFTKKPKSGYGAFDESYDSDFYHGDEDEDGVVGDFDSTDDTPMRDAATAAAPKKARSAQGGNMLKVVKPRNAGDGTIIADYLMDGYTVVMDIELLERPDAVHLIDFLLGALHVLGGELKRVTKTSMALSPRSGEVSFDETLGEDEVDEYR